MRKYLYHSKDPQSIYSYMDLLVENNHYYIKGKDLKLVNYQIENPIVLESIKSIEKHLYGGDMRSPHWVLTTVAYGRRS